MRVPRRKVIPKPLEGSFSTWLRIFSLGGAVMLVLFLFITWMFARWHYASSVMPPIHTPEETVLDLVVLGVKESKIHWIDGVTPGQLGLTLLSQRLLPDSVLWLRLPNILAGVFLPVVVALAAWRWSGRRNIAIWSGVFLAASPWSWHFASINSAAFVGLFWWIFAWLCMVTRRSAWWSDLLGAVFLVCAGITAPQFLLLIPGLLVVVLVQRRDDKIAQGWAAFSTALVGLSVAAITSFLQWNLYVEWGARSLLDLFQLLDWNYLVSRGGSIAWEGIPSTGHLNGMMVVLLFALFPIVIAMVVRQVSTQKESHFPSILSLIFLSIWSLAPVFFTSGTLTIVPLLFFFVLISIFTAFCIDLIWRNIQTELPNWCKILCIFVLSAWVVWHGLLWFLPAQVRWKYYISPHWNQGFISALNSEEVRGATSVKILDEQGHVLPLLLLQDAQLRSAYWNQGGGNVLQTWGTFGKYQVTPHPTDMHAETGVLLQPRSNTEWDIIKL